jgi:hypothetical protein
MRRPPGAAFHVYEEDEFLAAPTEEWRSEAAAPAAQPRFRRLAGGALIAGAILALGALALERQPLPGGSHAGATVGADGSHTQYLAASPASVPARVRFFGSVPRGNRSSLAARAPRARAGAVAEGHPRAGRVQVVAVRARTAARPGRVRTRAGSHAAPGRAGAPATARQGLAAVARAAAAEPAAGASTAAEGRPVASASGGAGRREHPEFGFER